MSVYSCQYGNEIYITKVPFRGLAKHIKINYVFNGCVFVPGVFAKNPMSFVARLFLGGGGGGGRSNFDSFLTFLKA